MTFSNTPAPSDVASFEVLVKLSFTRNGHAVQMRRVRLANPTIDSLKATVQQWACGSFTLQYTDCEGDTVTMDAEEEWAECLALWRAAGDAAAPLAVQVEQAKGKRAASPSGALGAADSSADDAVHGSSSSDVESASGSDECWMELLGTGRKGGKKGLCLKGLKGMKGCKGMKGRKGRKAWLKRCLFARRCGGDVEDEKAAAAEDAAAEDGAVAEGEACVEALAQLAAGVEEPSYAGTACEDEDFAWDFDPSGKLGMMGCKGRKGRKGAGKGLKRCFFARRCGWEVEDGLAAEPTAEGGNDSGAEHDLSWDLDAAGMKGGKGMKGCKGRKGWLKRCLFARRCRGWKAEDDADAADDDCAMADEEGVEVADDAAAADAVEDDDFAWDFDAAGMKGMKGCKGMKGGKGMKGCGEDDDDFDWDFDAAGLKGMKGMKGGKGMKGCGEDDGDFDWDLDAAGMKGCKGMKGGKGMKGCGEDDDDFAWDFDAAGLKGMKGMKGGKGMKGCGEDDGDFDWDLNATSMKGCKGRRGWLKRCLFARRCRGWKAEDDAAAEDAAVDDCAMADEEGVEVADDTCADADAAADCPDFAGKLGMKGCKGMKGWKGRRILKAWAAAQKAGEPQRAQVALVADEQAAGPSSAGAASEPPAACAGCGFVVTGVAPGHCCMRCSKNADTHGPRCAQLTPEAAAATGVPVSPVEWRGRKNWAAKYAAAFGQPAGCEGGGAAMPVAMGMKGGKKGKKGAKGCKGEKGARGERRSFFSWWGGGEGAAATGAPPAAPEGEPEACLATPPTDSPVKDEV